MPGTYLQPPDVDWAALEPFLDGDVNGEEFVAEQERLALAAAEAAEQQRYDDDARRRKLAQDNVRREREEAEMGGTLAPEAAAFRDARLRPRIAEAHEFEVQVRTPIVQGHFFRNSLTWIAGPSGTFKSFVTADLAFRFGDEELDYHGMRMTHGRALLVVAEGAAAYADRKAAWEKQHGREVKNVSIYPAPLQLGDTLKEMPALISYLKEEAEAGRPYDLILFDTQAMCTVGVDENSSEMNLVVNVLHRIREVNGACVMVVHHFGKNKTAGMRGSSMIYAAADTVCVLKRKEDALDVSLSTAQSDEGKQKDAIAEKDFLTLEMRAHAVGIDFFGDPVYSLVPARVDATSHDVHDIPEDLPEELPAVTEDQMIYLKLLAYYEERGGSPADLAAKLIEDRGPVPNARQNVRNRMIGLNKLEPALAEQRGTRWFITPMGVAVIARQLAVGDGWVLRAGRKYRTRGVENQDQIEVSHEVSEG